MRPSRFQNYELRATNLRFLFQGLILAFLSVSLSACGYTTRSMIGSQFKTIFIEQFVNKIDVTQETTLHKYRIYRPALETDITRSVTNRFLFDGNLKPVGLENADTVLKGELVEFRRDPLRYDNNDVVVEYRINIVVNISLWDTKENKLLWEENGFTGDTTYFTSGPQAKLENAAVSDALNDLARRIVERAVESW
jgi:hypothetical protein